MPKAFVQLCMTILRSEADSQRNDFLCRQCRHLAVTGPSANSTNRPLPAALPTSGLHSWRAGLGR